MAKRKSKSKRSLQALPKGLPQKRKQSNGGGKGADLSTANPFEVVRATKRPKHDVHNRKVSSSRPASALAQALQQRQEAVRASMQSSKKSNQLLDRRIGEEYGSQMTRDEQMLARLVKERSRQSKRNTKFQLDDDNNHDNNGDDSPNMLTHRGKSVDQLQPQDHAALLSDDDLSEDGELNVLDTELHFGGDNSKNNNNYKNNAMSPYGPAAGDGNDHHHDDLQQAYTQRKLELDELIARRKLIKAERLKLREEQEDQVTTLDDTFGELSQLLQFRDKKKERRDEELAKQAATADKKKNTNNNDKSGGSDSKIDEMADWDVEMRQYMYERRVQATDRTKTPEEIAKEEADRLHQLETRRLARMQGDFEDDDLSDVSDSDNNNTDQKKKKKKKRGFKKPKGKQEKGAEDLEDDYDASDDDDDSGNEELQPRFTGDGIVFVNKKGRVVDSNNKDKADENANIVVDDGDNEEEEVEDESEDDDDVDEEEDDEHEDEGESDSDDHVTNLLTLAVGTKVQGKYRAKEQFEEQGTWYEGVITKVHEQPDGTVRYDVEYDDGDFEEDMEPEHVRAIGQTDTEREKELAQKAEELAVKRKHLKAKQKARNEMPFVFEVPTTLEALHDMIGNFCATGEDASLMIQRIHATNSVRLDKRNLEKMQNFYDVLLRRFIAVGDAIYTSGDGGKELGRFQQLDELTKVLYKMAQDSPTCAGAVWGRRIGILQNAHAKRLRDAAFVGVNEEDSDDDDDEENTSAWPSTGVILLLRAMGHIFPVTDLRHPVVTPTLLMLGQMVTHTPIRSVHDVVRGLLCSALLLEYTREAKRIVPEALAFLSAVICLFASDGGCRFAMRSLEVAFQLPSLKSLRKAVSQFDANTIPSLSFEREQLEDPSHAAAAILFAALYLVETCAANLTGSLHDSEPELFADVTLSLLALNPSHKKCRLPKLLADKVASTAASLSSVCKLGAARKPLQRRAQSTVPVIKSLAPRMEDPSKYSFSKDKGKDAKQAALDRARREYKREKKAVSRELRLDATIIENERRNEQERKDNMAREKRQKNFAWLEGEQATMNQQVRLGGGLLKGGGVGAAKAKVATAKMGIKKGGRF